MAFEAMFQPIQIGKLTIRNRVLSTAHAEVYATDGGMTTDRYVKYYEEKAKGGIGLAICGGSSVVAIDSPQEWWSSVNLSTDRIIPHFQNLADAMHKHGAKIMIQITHMGRRSRWDGFNWPTLMSPSGIREPVHRATCKTIEPENLAGDRQLRPGCASGQGRWPRWRRTVGGAPAHDRSVLEPARQQAHR